MHIIEAVFPESVYSTSSSIFILVSFLTSLIIFQCLPELSFHTLSETCYLLLFCIFLDTFYHYAFFYDALSNFRYLEPTFRSIFSKINIFPDSVFGTDANNLDF